MKPVKQQIILVDQTHNTIMVESAKGNRYNVDLNKPLLWGYKCW